MRNYLLLPFTAAFFMSCEKQMDGLGSSETQQKMSAFVPISRIPLFR